MPDHNSQRDNFFLPELCSAQSLLVLVVLAELLALLITALQQGLYPVDWQYFSLVSLFCLWVFLACALLLCPLRGVLSRLPLPLAGSLVYGLILIAVALLSVLAQWAVSPRLPDQRFFNAEQLLINVFVAAVVAGIGLRYLYLGWQLRQRERSELAATVQALQSRIRPHFLFNSLNTIAGLIAEDAGKAERAVEDLSALFRASLQNSAVISSWAQERDLCERYLRIEQLRLGSRLRVRWDADAVPGATPMLNLSLQPLLENAIAHGIQPLPEGGEIAIAARMDDGVLRLIVTNPVPAGAAASHGNRLACDNLRDRLQAVYGERAGVDFRVDFGAVEGEFRVALHFPGEPA